MNSLVSRVVSRARAHVLNRGLTLEDAISRSLDEASDSFGIVDEVTVTNQANAALRGVGALEPFMADPTIEELWMNEPGILFVQRSWGVERIEIEFSSLDQEALLDRLLRSIGRRIDRTTPFVDAALPDGSRLHAVIPNVTKEHLSFNIRRYVANGSSLEGLGSVSSAQLAEFRTALSGRKTILVSGATAAGKTTLLSALLGELKQTERIVSVEDTFELNLSNVDWVAMQCRPASIEGDGEVDLRRLIREALRMRPGWLVVGEVRGAEAAELLVALNSGIPAICTIHANSAKHAITKLLTLPLLAGTQMPIDFVREVLVSTVGLIAHCGFNENGKRKLLELVSPSDLGF